MTYSGRLTTPYGPSSTAPTAAGDYTASASYTGDSNHTGSSDGETFTIAQAPSVTVVTVANATYDGNPHGGTANVTGAGGLDQSLAVTYTGRLSTTAVSNAAGNIASPAGDNPITCSGQTSANYNVRYVAGNLKVTKVTQDQYTGDTLVTLGSGGTASVKLAGAIRRRQTGRLATSSARRHSHSPSTSRPMSRCRPGGQLYRRGR